MQKQIYLGKNAVDDGPVQERATLFNELQNEIAVGWVFCTIRFGRCEFSNCWVRTDPLSTMG